LVRGWIVVEVVRALRREKHWETLPPLRAPVPGASSSGLAPQAGVKKALSFEAHFKVGQ